MCSQSQLLWLTIIHKALYQHWGTVGHGSMTEDQSSFCVSGGHHVPNVSPDGGSPASGLLLASAVLGWGMTSAWGATQ